MIQFCQRLDAATCRFGARALKVSREARDPDVRMILAEFVTEMAFPHSVAAWRLPSLASPAGSNAPSALIAAFGCRCSKAFAYDDGLRSSCAVLNVARLSDL
jgi:hypothetical protein